MSLPPADQLRDYAREVIAAGLPAGHAPRVDSWARDVDPAFSRHLGSAGLIGITWPSRYGGGDRTHVDRLVVTEELLRAGAPVAGHWIGDRQIGPALLRYGSTDLQQELLPPTTRGELVFCLGMSEPGAGSDLAAVRTRATRTRGGWVLRGHKVWTSHAHHATHMYVLARTDPQAPKHEGLTEFVVDMDTTGIDVSPIHDLGCSHHFNEVQLQDVFVPDRRVLGTVGAGWKQVIAQLSFERGGAERVLSTAPLLELLADRGDVDATTLGRLVADLAALRSLARTVAKEMDEGRAPVAESAGLKLLGNEFERRVTELARPFLHEPGPLGTLTAAAVLAGPGFSIRGGAADVLTSIVSKEIVPRKGDDT